MPPAHARRQPDPPAEAWFRRDTTLRLVQEVQRQAIPELTRVFGHTGLYLRPCPELPEALSGNMLADVLSLKREDGGFGGGLACADAALPLASGSLSLVYALFVLETSPDPAQLLREIARAVLPLAAWPRPPRALPRPPGARPGWRAGRRLTWPASAVP